MIFISITIVKLIADIPTQLKQSAESAKSAFFTIFFNINHVMCAYIVVTLEFIKIDVLTIGWLTVSPQLVQHSLLLLLLEITF